MAGVEIKFFVKKFTRFEDTDYVYLTGHKIICKNVRMKKDLSKQMEIRGHFPLGLSEEDEYEAKVEKKINKLNSSIYLEIIGLPKRIGLEKETSLAKYLKDKINEVPRINPKLTKWKLSSTKALKIVQYLGLDVINKIVEDPLQLLDYPDLELKEIHVYEMQEILSSFISLQKAVMLLQTSNINTSLIYKLTEIYGDKVFQILHDNPYQICYEGKIPFKVADTLAKDANRDINDRLRIKTGILDFMKYQISNGHVCILKKILFKNKFGHNLNTYLDYAGVYKKNNIPTELIDELLKELIDEGKIIFEEDFGTQYLYTPEMYHIENQLVDNVKNILSNTYNQKFCEETEIDEFLQHYEKNTNFILDVLQKKAVKNSLLNKLTILTGGPGTGKTATVSVIVNAIKYISKKIYNREPEIILAAPTGKAAERMTELTNELSSTLHRVLGLKYNNAPIEEVDADFLIVDESSMIDIFLMNNLLSSVTERTRILFVGDVNQLPSVGPGKILSDFISCNKIKYVQLKTIFRQAQGSLIVNNANRIISGLTSDMPNGIELVNDDTKNFKYFPATDSSSIKLLITQTIDDYLSKGKNLNEICVLTAKRKGELGVENLNELFQDKYNKNPVEYENEEKGICFKKADKVIQTVNNYNLGVFNGFVGEIVDIEPFRIVKGRNVPAITVYYSNLGYNIVYEGEDISELELAYVLTIHKAQGSEYPYVISPISLEQSVLLNRNLLYTDVTRARKEFVLLGDINAINKAILTEISDEERVSRISYKISTIC